jgi:23S rRNA (cytidine1920-2'-O)/16S rRNA (cytidine1409-2'-O)-methyltransferase
MKRKASLVALLDHLVKLYPEIERERLFSHVLCGDVHIDGGVIKDPKLPVAVDSEALISSRRFVSRGGFKLDPALELWNLPIAGKVFVDAGCSTGGFTDALLQRDAALVHAVDVGSAVLDWKLRSDPKVKVYEGTNVMALDSLSPQPHAAVADLSFRSLRGAAAKVLNLTSEGWMVALVKPQFEWVQAPEDFTGIVPEAAVAGILASLEADLALEGVRIQAWSPSALRGRKGNQEYLAWLVRY